jgi:outer membrane protein TolC
MRAVALLLLVALAVPATASAAPLTADEAVKIALEKSPGILQSQADVLSARSGLWGAYSRVLPSVSADASRSGSFLEEGTGSQAFGSIVVPSRTLDAEQYNGSYGLSGTWSILDPSGIMGLSSARSGMKSAELGHKSARADVVLETKRRFYSVVKAMHLSRVAAQALRLSRDDERRVRALFEVGSVSKSDLLRSQVRTAQSQVDSITTNNSVITSRFFLAQQLGIPENELTEVDTALAVTPAPMDAAVVLDEARRQRPDIQAAEAGVRAAELGLRSAHWARLPSVVLQGAWTPKSVASQRFSVDFQSPIDSTQSTSSEAKGDFSGRIAISMPIFDGFATDSRVAAARSQMVRARETRDALVRNLEGEVRQVLLGHQEAVEREALGRTAVESARENVNLVQQKYNVGSATILELIDSQVALLRAFSEFVSAMADIRIAEATVDRVRGKAE